MPEQNSLFPDNYDDFFRNLKERIRSTQVKAALAVNQELVLLYWQIGREILQRQQEEGWGTKVVDRLARDLKIEFPEMTGFSPRNLKYMRAFAEAYPDEAIVHQLGAQIPWKHNCAVLDKLKNQEQRVWYIQKTIENGWSRSVLIHQIEGDLYSRQGGALTNFEQTLPSPQSDLAQSLLKSEYNLEFLDLREKALERDLERALIERMQKFLLELGVGFAFVGSQYRLEVEGDEFFVDLLFYHLALSCFVAIELKTTDFNSHLAPVSISCKNRDAITINQGFEAHRTARNQVSDIGARSQLSLSIRGRLTSMSMSLMINYAALRITRRSGSFCVALRKSL